MTDIEEASSERLIEMQLEFERKMLLRLSKHNNVKTLYDNSESKIEKRAITKIQISYLIRILLNKEINEKNYYHYRKTYRIKILNDCDPILLDKKDLEVVSLDSMWDICTHVHRSIGYQGRQPMLQEAQKFYANVTRPIIELYLEFSEEYQIKKKKVKNHGLVVKPIRSVEFNSRWQIDLIDYRILPDGDYNWILTTQDHCTKFVWLSALKQKSGPEVAKALFELFGIFGAPYILQSDNGG